MAATLWYVCPNCGWDDKFGVPPDRCPECGSPDIHPVDDGGKP